MTKMVFSASSEPTLGVELELALVDRETFGLSSSIEAVLNHLPEVLQGKVKPELMQCYLEINTDICRRVRDARADLAAKLTAVEHVVDDLGLNLYWTATHPFSRWEDQRQSPNERYAHLLDSLQDVGRQLVTFGLHVHVGVDSGDKAVMICDRIMRHLPSLLALSCNSPWWNGRVSGLQSHRSKIMEGLPTAGLPYPMRNWSEYVWVIEHLKETGFIGSIRDIWWDVRPHHNFGTVEVRVCDMPGSLDDAMGIAALIHCLVFALSEEIDGGTYQHDYHPMMVRQNKWRAARYGLDASLVDTFTFDRQPARQVLCDMVDRLADISVDLRCEHELQHVRTMAQGPTWASRQLALLKSTGNPREVVKQMAAQSLQKPSRP